MFSEKHSSASLSLGKRLAPHPPKPPVETKSRAGRNLPAAIITGIVLLGLAALSLLVYIEIFVVLIALFLVVGLWEFSGATLSKQIKVSFPALLVAELLMVGVTWRNGLEIAFLCYLVTVVTSLVAVQFFNRARLVDTLVGVLGLTWIALPAIFAVAMALLPFGQWMVAALILLPVANDTGGWIAGILLGKHPILPRISPKKSWEGFAGSILLCLLTSYLTVGLLVELNFYWVLAFAILTPVLATAGDFAESLIKRDLGIKDMGSIFPGHGGMLDRVDSILFCAPLFFILFYFAVV